MELDEKMILKDLPVDTRNYTIIDNISGKPIDQSNYTLTIDAEVIKKLNQLKKINEEKVRQATLRDQYGDSSLVSTFTPEDNAVFTPMYNDEYIDIRDYHEEEKEEETVETPFTEDVLEITQAGAPIVTTSDTLLDRVVARDPSARLAEKEPEKVEEEPKEELDYISNYDPSFNSNLETPQSEDNQPIQDNSLFTPEMSSLQQASEQIVNIDTEKLGQDIKRTKASRKEQQTLNLDKMEIMAGKKIAWMAYILFFIPLLLKKNNRFVRIHANEGLELNIMEVISVLLIGQYFALPSLMTNVDSSLHTVSLILCLLGAGLIVACAISVIGMIIASLLGKHCQTPWLWKGRIIKVPNERTSD